MIVFFVGPAPQHLEMLVKMDRGVNMLESYFYVKGSKGHIPKYAKHVADCVKRNKKPTRRTK